MNRNPVKPGGKGRLTGKAAKGLIGFNKNLLGNIFSIFLLVHETHHYTKHRCFILYNQLSKISCMAGKNGLYQYCFLHAGSVYPGLYL